MKNIFILISIFLCLFSCKTVKYSFDKKYHPVIIFLHNNFKNESFHVVDTLVYLSQTNRFVEGNNLAQLDSLESLDIKYSFLNEYYHLGEKRKSAINNVYFSKPIFDYLDIEIINNKGNINNSYKYLTSFNTSKIYRFKFNKNNEVVNISKINKIYN
jgi:hypothetical protein